jgi:hypothetical protein
VTLPRYHPLQIDAILSGLDLIPPHEAADLEREADLLRHFQKGEQIDLFALDAAVAKIATVVARHRPPDL